MIHRSSTASADAGEEGAQVKDYAKGRILLDTYGDVSARVKKSVRLPLGGVTFDGHKMGDLYGLFHAKRIVVTEVIDKDFNKRSLACFRQLIREACAEAIADTKRKERRRAARIVRRCLDPDRGGIADGIANLILGRPRRKA